MKLHGYCVLTKVLPVFRRIFPAGLLRIMDEEFLPEGNYARKAMPRQVVVAMLKAVILRLSCQSEILRLCPFLGLRSRTALGYIVDQPWMKTIVEEMQGLLTQMHPIYSPAVCKRPRLLLDSMPVLIQKTQRGHAAKFNNVAKGCGVMTAFNLDAEPRQCIVELLKIMPGSWNDTYQVRTVGLRKGPLYVVDRGFYSLETIFQWCRQGIHFIARGKKKNMTFTVERELPFEQPDTGNVLIQSDAVVLLGKASSQHRTRVRLLRAHLIKKNEDLWLLTDQFDCSAKQLLDDYLKRGTVEVYHRFVKNSFGLAHLYSFDQTGIEFQIHLVVLVANLVFLQADPALSNEVGVLRAMNQTLKQIRQELGLLSPWKRNTVAQRRNKPPHNRRHLRTRNSETPQQMNL